MSNSKQKVILSVLNFILKLSSIKIENKNKYSAGIHESY